jgi:hypothetical protein
MMPGRQKHVEQSTDPGPIGRGPEAVARLREEILRHLHAGQVPEQNAVGVQRAFGVSRRAGRIDDDCRIFGRRIDGREGVRGPRTVAVEIDGAGTLPVNREDTFEFG